MSIVMILPKGLFAHLPGILQQDGCDLWGNLPHEARLVL